MKRVTLPVSWQQVILILSLTLIYLPNGDLLLFSPAILISILSFFVFIKYFVKDFLLSSLLLLSLFVILFNPALELKESARIIFSNGSVYCLRYIRLSSKNAFYPLVIFFGYELLTRIISGNFSELNIYSIKGSAGLFNDSNFVGLILVYCIAGLLDKENTNKEYGKIAVFSFFLLATFSRTAWLMLFAYFISTKSRIIGVLLAVSSAVIPVYLLVNQVDTINIDGSLASKITILQTFIYVLNNAPSSLLWGLGRLVPGEIAESLSGTGYEGHTIYGQITQYGLILNVIFYAIAYQLSKLVVKKPIPYLLSVLVGGFLGLSPTSYFGMTLLVYGVLNRNGQLVANKRRGVIARPSQDETETVTR